MLIGASFTFVLALGDFVTPQMVGGMSGITFGRIVYSQFGLAFNWPFGAALAVVMLVVVLAVLWLASSPRAAAGGGRDDPVLVRPARACAPWPRWRWCSSTGRCC